MQQQYQNMEIQLNQEKVGSEGLKTKMKRLYATLSGVTNEKQVLDQVFGDVLNADDEIGGTTDEYGSPGK